MPYDPSKQARKINLNGLQFDSIAESKFYLRLARIFGEQNVRREVTINLTEIDPNIPTITWNVDFLVIHDDGTSSLVEFKGPIKGRREHHREFILKWNLSIRGGYKVLVIGEDATFSWRNPVGIQVFPENYRCASISDSTLKNLILENRQLWQAEIP